MLSERIITRFPAIEVGAADEAGDIVGLVRRRTIVEAGLSKLEQNN